MSTLSFGTAPKMHAYIEPRQCSSLHTPCPASTAAAAERGHVARVADEVMTMSRWTDGVRSVTPAIAMVLLSLAAVPLARADVSGNDTCATAENFGGNGTRWGTLDLAGGDGKDFYRRWINAGDSIYVEMTPWGGSNEFNLVLYYPTCVIADFNYQSGTESVSFTATTSGYWYSEVWVQFGSGGYDLYWSVSTPPPPPCEPTEAPAWSYNVFFVNGNTYYIEERGGVYGPTVPFSGMLLGGSTWIYQETNALTGLQRGGIGLLGSEFPPGGPTLIYGEDPINDETCGNGPDQIIVGIDPAI